MNSPRFPINVDFDDDPTPSDTIDKDQFREVFMSMPRDAQERVARFFERIIKKPEGMELTDKQRRAMLDNDTDLPLH